MANNLRKFNTYSDYEAAVLVKPAVSLIAATDEVIFDQKDAPVPPTPTFSGLTVHYNIDSVGEYPLFNGGGSGSGSGSGSGGALPSAMIIDGTAVEVTNTYQFSTTGEHIVNYSFADNQIPKDFMNGSGDKFPHLVGVEIGDAITSIYDHAFENCRSLTSCTIGSGVTSIGANAFNNCTSLPSVNIPSGVTSIGDNAFNYCTSLTSCTIGSGVTSIGDGAFIYCSGLTSIDIPNGVTSIGASAFYYCSGMTSCTIGSGVTSIGGSAFSNCSSLTSIICNAVTAPTIQSTTFRNVKTGGTLTVPSGSSGYDVWMQNANYYLGLYGWTKVEQ